MTDTIEQKSTRSKSNVGAIGAFYAGYMLAWKGWSVLQTTRNAKGPDIIIASEDGKNMKSLQIKSLSRRADVSLGKKFDDLAADFLIVCVDVTSEDVPDCYILTRNEVKKLAGQDKGGARAWWLQARDFMQDRYLEAWDRIGKP